MTADTPLEAALVRHLTVDDDAPADVLEGAVALHSLIDLDARLAEFEPLATAIRSDRPQAYRVIWGDRTLVLELIETDDGVRATGVIEGDLDGLTVTTLDGVTTPVPVHDGAFEVTLPFPPFRFSFPDEGLVSAWFHG